MQAARHRSVAGTRPQACLGCLIALPRGQRTAACISNRPGAAWGLQGSPQAAHAGWAATQLAAIGGGGPERRGGAAPPLGDGDAGRRQQPAPQGRQREQQEQQQGREQQQQQQQWEGDQEQQQAGREGAGEPAAGDGQHDGPAVRAALALLRFYREGISPLMQSTCRFAPTCSQYSIDSYRRYGAARGTVLTAWRLLRCNPWGGGGYDPTSWPPVGLPAPLFAWSGSAEVAVVLGAALVLRLGHALLFE